MHNMTFRLVIILVNFLCLWIKCEGSLSDVTSRILGSSDNGVVAAFGDFDADKATDIFVVSNDGKDLIVLVGHTSLTPTVTETPFTARKILDKDDTKTQVITNVVPMDFNGDSFMDVMLTLQNPGDVTSEVSIRIYWGNGLNVDRKNPLNFEEKFRDQPAVVDVNGDMIPDLLGENTTGRAFWILSDHRNYTVELMKNDSSTQLPPLMVPQASAFVDFNNDFVPDLIVSSVDSEKRGQFEVWNSMNGEFVWNQTILIPDKAKAPGHPVFIDMDGDHSVDIVLPACSDSKCTSSLIFVWSKGKWHNLNINFKNEEGVLFNFAPLNRPVPWLNVPASLRAGDFNLNSYIDVVTVLTTSINGNVSYGAYLMENVACTADCDGFSRTFHPSFTPLAGLTAEPIQVSFFDIMDNGVLDVLVTIFSGQGSHITALKQSFAEDACFMKIMVLSGLCNDDCPGGHRPYGVNQIGPVVRFQTTTPQGTTQVGFATQLTQTSYFALQLPFVHFGLGQMPNFVEKLEVGIQHPKGQTAKHREWTQLIPNSQLVIIPYPTDEPSSWANKLFVTPSRLVLITGAALLGTCGFIAGIVGILHWRERVEDKKEKLQEAHKFHFDAM